MTIIRGFQPHVTSANLLPLQKQDIVLLAQYLLSLKQGITEEKDLHSTKNYIFILCAALLHFND